MRRKFHHRRSSDSFRYCGMPFAKILSFFQYLVMCSLLALFAAAVVNARENVLEGLNGSVVMVEVLLKHGARVHVRVETLFILSYTKFLLCFSFSSVSATEQERGPSSALGNIHEQESSWYAKLFVILLSCPTNTRFFVVAFHF